MVQIFELPEAGSADAGSAPKTTGLKSEAQPLTDSKKQVPVSLFIATPAFGCRMDTGFVTSMLRLQTKCLENGIEVLFQALGNESLIPRARNILTEQFIQTSSTHLLFLDADITFAPETIISMIKTDKDVISCLYPKKCYNYERFAEWAKKPTKEPIHQVALDFNINLFQQSDDGTNRSHVQEGNLVRVLDAATGCLLIKRGVIEQMREKYRKELYVKNDILHSNIKDYIALFETYIDKGDPNNPRSLSEDFAWCRRWQAMGGEIWADISQPLIHRGSLVTDGDIRQRLKKKVCYDME